ncbi:ISRm2011-2 transposase protein [Nitrobacter sp. Nb-311A]|nr:ISRm2011-2 transposase protein [Nitrobacter sp. Nb-311A]
MHRRDLPEGLHPAPRRSRANPDRRKPGSGADRDGYPFHGRDVERRGLLLHLAARGAEGLLHATEGHRSACDRGLFRQEPPGDPARQLRTEGRQDFRFHQPHHADIRSGDQLSPAAVQAAEREVKLRFISAPSPDLNPIEQFFAKLKHWLRKAASRATDALEKATSHILATLTANECSNDFANAGYDQA